MTEEEQRKAHRTSIELRETEEAFQSLRAAFVELLFKTEPGASAEREQLYMAVKVLDRVRGVMTKIVKDAADTAQIEEAADAFRKGVKNG